MKQRCIHLDKLLCGQLRCSWSVFVVTENQTDSDTSRHNLFSTLFVSSLHFPLRQRHRGLFPSGRSVPKLPVCHREATHELFKRKKTQRRALKLTPTPMGRSFLSAAVVVSLLATVNAQVLELGWIWVETERIVCLSPELALLRSRFHSCYSPPYPSKINKRMKL